MTLEELSIQLANAEKNYKDAHILFENAQKAVIAVYIWIISVIIWLITLTMFLTVQSVSTVTMFSVMSTCIMAIYCGSSDSERYNYLRFRLPYAKVVKQSKVLATCHQKLTTIQADVQKTHVQQTTLMVVGYACVTATAAAALIYTRTTKKTMNRN